MREENVFRKHLKQMGKKPHVIDGLINEVSYFESWLIKNKNRTLEQATQEDLEEFAKTLDEREIKIYMRALALFYRWLGNDELKELAHAMREKETAKTRRIFYLLEFVDVIFDAILKLEILGIKNTEDILLATRTHEMRKELAIRSGISPETILELAKLSDLSRLPGVKGVRARLYYNAGIDNIEAFRHWKPGEFKSTSKNMSTRLLILIGLHLYQ